MAVVAMLTAALIIVFYKELLVSSFDGVLVVVGRQCDLAHYALKAGSRLSSSAPSRLSAPFSSLPC